MFTGACKKITGNGLAADCQLFYRKIYGNFYSVQQSVTDGRTQGINVRRRAKLYALLLFLAGAINATAVEGNSCDEPFRYMYY